MTDRNDIHEYYEFCEELGSGEFSTVIRGIEKSTRDEYAIKCIEKHQVDTSRLETEITILKLVDHPHIISLKQYFDTPTTLYLVMELVTGGELFDKITQIGCYTEAKASILVGNILRALHYLHELGIAHRDLKPTNLLLKSPDDDTNVKIADFGLSKIVGENAIMQTACGTPIYVAPEVLKGEAYEKEIDLWSVGVITYILLCGFPPFFDDGSNMGQLFDQIMSGEYEYPDEYWADISDEAKDLIDNLLLVDPEERFTAAQALVHPWIANAERNSQKELHVQKNLKEFTDKSKQH